MKNFQELADSLSQAVQVESGKGDPISPAVYGNEFSESMENDLGTPGAVHALEELAQAILEAAKGRRNVQEAQQMLRKYGLVLGLSLGSEPPEQRVVKGWNSKKR